VVSRQSGALKGLILRDQVASLQVDQWQKMLPEKRPYLFYWHPHYFNYNGIPNNGWRCDGKHFYAQCMSGITDYF
jgi:hypothetical protein